MQARGGGDIDDGARFAVLDTKVWGSGTDELEGCGIVKGNDGIPLLIGCLLLSVLQSKSLPLTGSPCG